MWDWLKDALQFGLGAAGVGASIYGANQAGEMSDEAKALLAVQSQMSNLMYGVAQQQWDWAKPVEAAKQDILLGKEVEQPVLNADGSVATNPDGTPKMQKVRQGGTLQQQGEVTAEQLRQMQEGLIRDKQLYRPVEDKMIREATEGVDEQKYMGRASADVAQAFANSDNQLRRDMSRSGMDPTSGRALAAMRGTAMDRAKAEAGGRTAATWKAEDETRNLRSNLMNVRRGMASSFSNFMGGNIAGSTPQMAMASLGGASNSVGGAAGGYENLAKMFAGLSAGGAAGAGQAFGDAGGAANFITKLMPSGAAQASR